MKFINLKNTALTGALLSVMVLSSCKKDFLDVTPSNSIANTEAFNSAEKLQSAMTGIYDLNTFSGYTNNILLNMDVKGEDVLVNSTNNYSRFIAGYQYIETVNSSELSVHWQYSYRIIANCNQLIENVPAAPVTEAVKLQYTAEARAMRAYAHFNLVREFAKPYTVDPTSLGVPVVEKSIGPNDTFPARATVAATYTSIVADLVFAEANFPASATNTFRLTKGSIQGLLARVYLTMGDYANASKYAKLARTGYTLGNAASLLAGFSDKTSEWIWGIDVRADDNNGFLQVQSFYDPYDDGYSSFRVAKEFLDLFADNDIRKNQMRIPATRGADPRTGDYELLGNGYLTSKFVFRGAWDNDQLLMRASEMVLIEAEAEARLGNTAAAKAALLIIQQRAIPTAVLSANTGDALVQEILIERRKELFGEGHRYYDILRTKQTLNRSASVSHWSKLVIASGDKRFALPIPQAEIDANPNVVQNPL
jgi:hypothetical protein